MLMLTTKRAVFQLYEKKRETQKKEDKNTFLFNSKKLGLRNIFFMKEKIIYETNNIERKHKKQSFIYRLNILCLDVPMQLFICAFLI